jgi:energy-coupling factor transporter ATP-binding protein EcfA2
MSEVKISFKNYKLLKDGELNLSNGTIFFAQGPNNVGKTSFLNLIQAIMEVKDNTINPVTFGEKDGFSTGTIPGADGLMYQYRYDFNIDGKAKFQFIGPDNKVIKTVSEMRAIFNYTHFTMEEFFDWSKTVPGRKKQRDIFMNLLSDKERKDIIEIDEKINTTSGEFVLSRRALNNEIEFLQKKVDTSILTIEDKNLLSQKEQVNKLFDEVLEQKEQYEKIINGSSGITEKINSLKSQIEMINDHHNNYLNSTNNQIEDIDKQIQLLTANRKLLIEERENSVSLFNERKNKLSVELKEVSQAGSITAEELELKRKELVIINERIEKGQKTKDAILIIETKEESVKYEKEQLELKKNKADEFNTNIEILRTKKKDIIKNSENIPLGWSLDDDCITINNIPFTETDLSKSQATKAIAELMMRINKAPIMLMGDAEALGYEILDDLLSTAKEMGKLMIFAEHVRNAEELQLICYDDLEKPESKSKKELF